uniref:Uncharacterized protein n=2 Tax=Anguilla anguilla TaxID=7936 RepID=A0A0E9UYK1_ANGAN
MLMILVRGQLLGCFAPVNPHGVLDKNSSCY